MTLVEERDAWRKKFDEGIFSFYYYRSIVEYRMNRNSELWRSTRLFEELLEYINWLEEKAGIEIYKERNTTNEKC